MKCNTLLAFLLISFTFNLSAQELREKLPLIIDADTANEIDDLFAIVRAIGEPSFDLLGITAAQFHTSPYATENTALESHLINQRLASLLPNYIVTVKNGSSQPLKNLESPQSSDASRFIISKALELKKDKKLQIVILGSCTNVASALLEAPEIAPKLIISYLGFWHNPYMNTYNKNEFNTKNDSISTNYLLNFKGLDFRVMPATVSKHLVFSKVNTFKNLKENNLSKYLKNRWNTYKRWWTSKDPKQEKWIMWDLAIIESLAHPEWAKMKSFKTPKENIQRNIQIYTSIDTLKMKQDFWRHYQDLTK